MTISAQLIIRNVQVALNDVDGVRYPASDLVRHLNKAQRDVQSVRPDVTAATTTWSLVEGVYQDLPSYAAALLDIPANATGRRRRITKVDKRLLDATEPEWRATPAAEEIKHFMHDMKLPRKVEVWPPAASSSTVELEYSAHPEDIPQPTGAGDTFSTVIGESSFSAKWQSVLEMLVLHYAYSLDLEGARNQELAAQYLQMASSQLGVELQAAAATSPKD